MDGTVLFYVQHLLGIGHLFRAKRIAEALVADGFAVHVAMGGVPIPDFQIEGVSLTQLPAVAAGPSGFSDLVDVAGKPVDAVFKEMRCKALANTFASLEPDIVLIEAFPFGRRQMRFELLPLLRQIADMGERRPYVACSVRDILQENRKAHRNEETAALLHTYFDLLLVHGDPNLAALTDTFPNAAGLKVKTVHTGLVAPPAPMVPAFGMYDIVVSAGGGAVGNGILETGLAAARGPWKDKRVLMLAGPNLADPSFAALRADLPGNVTLKRFLPDLPAVLAGCTLSVSQAGYNTVADVLVAGCAAVLVPFATGGETEQRRRAQMLAAGQRAILVEETALSVDSLAAAARQALAQDKGVLPVDLEGAANSARVLRELLVTRR